MEWNQDFTRITACVRHAVQLKRLEITTVVCLFFNTTLFSEILSETHLTDMTVCLGVLTASVMGTEYLVLLWVTVL